MKNFTLPTTTALQKYLVLFVLLLSVNVGWGQYSITGTGSGNTYTQNFNSYSSPGTSISNWAISGTTTSQSTITAGTSIFSSNNGNGFYAARPNGTSTDYSMVMKQGTSGSSTITFSVTNNTGSSLNGFTITWDARQYSTTNRPTTLNFSYQINAGGYGILD